MNSVVGWCVSSLECSQCLSGHCRDTSAKGLAWKGGLGELPVQASGFSVGIIGAGPAGVACAVRLLELGHSVTIYDSSKSVGGTAAAVIPGIGFAAM